MDTVLAGPLTKQDARDRQGFISLMGPGNAHKDYAPVLTGYGNAVSHMAKKADSLKGGKWEDALVTGLDQAAQGVVDSIAGLVSFTRELTAGERMKLNDYEGRGAFGQIVRHGGLSALGTVAGMGLGTALFPGLGTAAGGKLGFVVGSALQAMSAAGASKPSQSEVDTLTSMVGHMGDWDVLKHAGLHENVDVETLSPQTRAALYMGIYLIEPFALGKVFKLGYTAARGFGRNLAGKGTLGAARGADEAAELARLTPEEQSIYKSLKQADEASKAKAGPQLTPDEQATYQSLKQTDEAAKQADEAVAVLPEKKGAAPRRAAAKAKPAPKKPRKPRLTKEEREIHEALSDLFEEAEGNLASAPDIAPSMKHNAKVQRVAAQGQIAADQAEQFTFQQARADRALDRAAARMAKAGQSLEKAPRQTRHANLRQRSRIETELTGAKDTKAINKALDRHDSNMNFEATQAGAMGSESVRRSRDLGRLREGGAAAKDATFQQTGSAVRQGMDGTTAMADKYLDMLEQSILRQGTEADDYLRTAARLEDKADEIAGALTNQATTWGGNMRAFQEGLKVIDAVGETQKNSRPAGQDVHGQGPD